MSLKLLLGLKNCPLTEQEIANAMIASTEKILHGGNE